MTLSSVHASPETRPRVERVALTATEAAQSLGVSRDFFDDHIALELRWIRRGRKKLVPVTELTSWADRVAARTFDHE
jgi:hypothetical protein